MTDVCVCPQKEEETTADAEIVDGPASENEVNHKALPGQERKAMRVSSAG